MRIVNESDRMVSTFKLSTTLSGHEQDVRSVVAASNESIVSGLRDATARVWHPLSTDASKGWSSEVPIESTIAFQLPTNAFINAVTYIPNEKEPLLAAAGQEAIIYLTLPQDNFVKAGDDFGKYQLVGHSGNICALSYKDGYVISGSWDSTAKIWDLESCTVKFDLQGHQSSVWDAKIVDASKNIFLTCSADRTIRKWIGNKQVAEYSGHNDVIRKLLVFPDAKSFASVSNDGTIKVWDLDSGAVLQTLVGHDSFVYDIGILSNGDLATTGEDRTVRVWRNGNILQVITLPCISVWCLSVLPNDDIVVGGSDNNLRVFTRDSNRFAPQFQIQEFVESVQQSSIAEQSIDDLKRTDIPSSDILQNPGKQEGQTIMVKNPAGVIEAHQWSGGEWAKIGDVVGSAGGGSGKKVDLNGQKWDYVFDVDVEDGKPPLKLPYNSNESPYAAAERFLADNELPASYLQEVVQFIEKNTAGVQLDQQLGPTANPYADVHDTPAPAAQSKTQPSILPQKTLISFKDFKAETLMKGLTKFNNEQADSKFTESELSQISTNLLSLNSKEALELITFYIPKIINEWDASKKLIGYDLLRVSIPRVTTVDLIRSTDAAETVLKALNTGFDEVETDGSPLFMMLLKILNNLVGSTLFLQLYITTNDSDNQLSYNEFFEELVAKLESITENFASSQTAKASKHYNTTLTALSSFIYNLSALVFINSSLRSNPSASAPVVSLANGVAYPLIESNAEAAYRLSMAFGNFAVAKTIEVSPEWSNKVKALYGSEPRFAELDQDLKKI